MTYILLGILIGWLIPRPKFIGKIEMAIWNPIKSKLPKSITNFFGQESTMAITIGPEQKNKLMTLIGEGSNVLGEIDDLRGGLNDTIKAVAQELDIKPGLLSKAVKIAHKRSFAEEEKDFEELEAILDAVGKKQSVE